MTAFSKTTKSKSLSPGRDRGTHNVHGKSIPFSNKSSSKTLDIVMLNSIDPCLKLTPN